MRPYFHKSTLNLIKKIFSLKKESFGPIGFGKAISAGWITTEVKNGVSLVVRKAKLVEDKARHELKQIKEGMHNLDTKTIGNLKKRKWINEMCISLK